MLYSMHRVIHTIAKQQCRPSELTLTSPSRTPSLQQATRSNILNHTGIVGVSIYLPQNQSQSITVRSHQINKSSISQTNITWLNQINRLSSYRVDFNSIEIPAHKKKIANKNGIIQCYKIRQSSSPELQVVRAPLQWILESKNSKESYTSSKVRHRLWNP